MKLKDDSLSRLLPLTSTLSALTLDGCKALTAKAAYHLQRLTSLTSLSLQGLQPILLLCFLRPSYGHNPAP